MSSDRRDRARAIGRIAEESGPLDDTEGAWRPRDTMYALARFSAHIEYDVGGRWEFEDGPQDVGVDEALAWCRERAAKVVVQWFGPDGTTHSSAGDVPVVDAPQWEPQALVPRRIPGWEHLDRTDEDGPISWEVVARGAVTPPTRDLAGDLRAALSETQGPDLVAVKVERPPGGTMRSAARRLSSLRTGGFSSYAAVNNVAAHLRVDARTYDEACRLAADACAAPSRRCAPDSHQSWDPENAEAYPTGSRAAENASVDQHGYSY